MSEIVRHCAVLCERCKIFKTVTLPSIQIDNPVALHCQLCFKLKWNMGYNLWFYTHQKQIIPMMLFLLLLLTTYNCSRNKVTCMPLSFFGSTNENNFPVRFSDSCSHPGGLFREAKFVRKAVHRVNTMHLSGVKR